MVAVASYSRKIVALIDRVAFARAIQQHTAERAAKGFSWDHLVTMLFCQMVMCRFADALFGCTKVGLLGPTGSEPCKQ